MIYKLRARDSCRYTLPDQSWCREVRGTRFCRYCSTVIRGHYPKPIDAYISQLYKNLTYDSVSDASIGIIHEGLLQILAPYLEGYVFGQCFDEDGSHLSQYRTMYHWRYISIRDGRAPSSWVCRDCGVTVHIDERSPYALSAELVGARVWQDVFCRLFVDEQLAKTIDWTRFRDIELFPIEVRDQIIEPAATAVAPSARAAAARPKKRPPAPAAPPVGQPRDRTPLGNRLRKSLRERGLDAEEVTFLMGHARVGFKIEPASALVLPQDEVPLGASRLGGLPDLPANLEWPCTPNGRPLGFLAQLNLADARGVRTEILLPETGQLYFFYDDEEQPWGNKLSDRDGWRVLFTEAAEADLCRAEAPEEMADDGCFDVRAVRLEPTLFLPSEETVSALLEANPRAAGGAQMLTKALASDVYATWASEIHGLLEGEMDHRFLGQPAELQSAMPGGLPTIKRMTPAPAAARGSDLDSSEGECMPISEWRLLLQLDTNGGPGWMWGDSGRLYFWIPREALRLRLFDRVWVNLQCF